MVVCNRDSASGERAKKRCQMNKGGVFFRSLKELYLTLTVLVDRYCWDQSVSFLYVDVFPPSETTFTVTGLQPVTTYNFSVNALNAIGESEYADNNAVLTITTKGQFGVTPL